MAEKQDHNSAQPGSGRDAGRPRGTTPAPFAEAAPAASVGMDAIAAAVLVCSADGTIVDLNEAASSLLAIDRQRARGSSLRQVRGWAGTWITEGGEHVEPAASTIAKLAFSGERVEGEVFGLRGDGDVPSRWLRIAAEPLLSPAGGLEHVVLTLVDITNLKETRDALEATAAELSELVRALPDTYLQVDGSDIVRRVGGAREAGHGVPRALTAAGIGSRLWDSLPEDAASRLRNAAALARATRTAVTAEIATVTPTSVRYDEVRHFPHDDGSLLVIVRDVTEQRRAARALAERDRTMQTLLANVPGLAYRCTNDRDWTMQVLSSGCKAMTGYEPDELLGASHPTWGDLVLREDTQGVWDDIQDALAERAPWTLTYRIRARDGRTRWVWERGVGVFDDDELLYLEGFISDITDLHAAEEALREREQMLSAVVASLPGAVYRSELREPWQTTFLSEGFRTLLGHDPEAVTRGDVLWADVVHPDDTDRLEDDIDRDLAAGSETTESEYRIFTTDGEVRWVLDRAMFVRDAEGEPTELIGMLFDVTDLHEALDAQAESERRLRTTIDNIPGMVYRSQAAAPWSDEFIAGGDVSVTGYSVDELTAPDFRWDQIMHPDDVPLLQRESDAALEAGRGSTEYRIIAKDGSERWLLDRFSLLKDGHGTPIAQEGILLDVTEQHRVERALRESEQRYRALYDGSPMGVFLYDLDLRLVDCNPAFAEILGGSAESHRGSLIPDLNPDLEFLEPMRAALDGQEGVYEGSYTTRTGRSLWITLKIAPRYDADGEIIGATGVVVDRTQEKRSEEAVRHIMLHDPVTGLANRSLLEDRVGQALKHAQRKRLSFALAMFRVDRFDAVEASLGLPAIHGVLEELGRRLSAAGRAEDTVAYLGGGVFAALLPGAAGPVEATAAVSGLLTAVGEPVQADHRELFLTLSLGVAIYPTDGAATGELLRNADAAMRQASDAGGDRWQFFHPGLNEEQADRLTLEAELHRALEHSELFLEYQPLIAAATEEVVGVEALVRWRHPERGTLKPLDFIPVAEDSGFLGQIGAWVLDEACRQGRAWQRRFGKPLRMSVNIGARQLHDHTLVDTVRRTLRATGFDAHSLELEITETAAMRDARHTAQILGALRAMGVRVALDDFGTGYSSLSHLVRLPISTVKIDRSFVRDLLSVPEHAAVAASVIALGHRLGLTVVAEGVETIGERGALRDEGCDVIQGFLYARPLPPGECEKLLEAGVIRR